MRKLILAVVLSLLASQAYARGEAGIIAGDITTSRLFSSVLSGPNGKAGLLPELPPGAIDVQSSGLENLPPEQGFEIICGVNSMDYPVPDMYMASRAMTEKEASICETNAVAYVEIPWVTVQIDGVSDPRGVISHYLYVNTARIPELPLLKPLVEALVAEAVVGPGGYFETLPAGWLQIEFDGAYRNMTVISGDETVREKARKPAAKLNAPGVPEPHDAHDAPATAPTFDGITIIELSDKTAGEPIRGSSVGTASYIVTFVSADGSYAALGDGHARLCVAWAQAANYSGNSITFGVPPSEQSQKAVHPSVCQPFTLSFSGPDRVRIEATGRYERTSGPLAPNAKEIRYSGEHEVLARVPLAAFDWGMPVFSRHAIKGVPLGPIPALRERLGSNVKFNLSPLERLSSGTRKILTITMTPSDPVSSTTVSGHVAAAEVLGWPWDVLHIASYHEYLTEQALTEAFEHAVRERYGRPSRVGSGRGAGTIHLHWFFDLAGQQLQIDSAAPENCLNTREHWINEVGFGSIHDRDIGPWGCALIMLLIHDGENGTLGEYSVQAASGYVMALNHFIQRLEEVRAMRQKIEEVKSYRPKL
ncbi:hypothetical protein [Mesorhizobium mediterraneum]|uniref:hypothetical protein n=1 Tax=Mesorhizobium mediterraneum TaxID=43617 RepID=UPI00177C6825|nr:hypothetical protein [Mesorhizobium mediterraneum]